MKFGTFRRYKTRIYMLFEFARRYKTIMISFSRLVSLNIERGCAFSGHILL